MVLNTSLLGFVELKAQIMTCAMNLSDFLKFKSSTFSSVLLNCICGEEGSKYKIRVRGGRTKNVTGILHGKAK